MQAIIKFTSIYFYKHGAGNLFIKKGGGRNADGIAHCVVMLRSRSIALCRLSEESENIIVNSLDFSSMYDQEKYYIGFYIPESKFIQFVFKIAYYRYFCVKERVFYCLDFIHQLRTLNKKYAKFKHVAV